MSWYQNNGADSDIAISSRARLARNFAKYPFPGRMTLESEKEVLKAAGEAMPDYVSLSLRETDQNRRGALMEQHLISPELASADNLRGVLLSKDESVSVMVNEEDHLRIQALCAGFAPREALNRAMEADSLLEQAGPYAFDAKLGYLTRCPTNLGTGLRAGVMLHLPVLTESGAMKDLIVAAGKLGFAVRGLYGEGTAAQGALYQISNQVTLGVTEEEIVSRLERVVASILYQERGLRAHYMQQYTDQIRDRVWRAAGILSTARLLPLQEAMTLLSDVRLGLSCKILSGISMEEINTILFEMQPNCMMAAAGRPMNNLERDKKRADFVREIIGKAVK